VQVKEDYDGSFTLAENAEAELVALLSSPDFQLRVAKEAGFQGTTKFTGVLFQPVRHAGWWVVLGGSHAQHTRTCGTR
jgi:hypothetical protein